MFVSRCVTRFVVVCFCCCCCFCTTLAFGPILQQHHCTTNLHLQQRQPPRQRQAKGCYCGKTPLHPFLQTTIPQKTRFLPNGATTTTRLFLGQQQQQQDEDKEEKDDPRGSAPRTDLSSSSSSSSSASAGGFNGEGFANYLAPYALALVGSIAVTVAFVQYVLLGN